MHELSICRSIVDVVDRHAAGRGVEVINLQVGELRQIVPDTLVYCWTLVTADTALASSQLRVDRVTAAIRCKACGHGTALTGPILVCEACDGRDVEIVAGEEFLITSLELVEA